MKNNLLPLCCLALSLPAAAETMRKTFPARPLKKISVQLGSGKILFEASSRADVEVEISDKDLSQCDLVAEAAGDALTLTAQPKRSPRGFFNFSSCAPAVSILAPKTVELNASSGSGDIHVQGLAGALRAATGSGDISGDDPSADVSLRSGSGTISLTGLLGDASARTGSGNVTLEWARPPRGNVRVRTGSGEATLLFPKGTKLKADVRSGSGEFSNALGDAPDAALSVSVRTGSGDVALKSRP